MWERMVSIDYEQLADLLIEQCDVDLPVACARFERLRAVLEEHLDAIMDTEQDVPDPNPALTEVLLKHYHYGLVHNAIVTKNPGIVLYRGDEVIVLPRVIIELEYTEF